MPRVDCRARSLRRNAAKFAMLGHVSVTSAAKPQPVGGRSGVLAGAGRSLGGGVMRLVVAAVRARALGVLKWLILDMDAQVLDVANPPPSGHR